MASRYPTQFQNRTLWNAATGLSIVVLGALLVGLVWLSGTIFGYLQPVLVPLAVAGIIAYLLDPLVTWMQRRGLSRLRAVIVTFCGFVMALCLAALLILPPVFDQIGELAADSESTNTNMVEFYEEARENPVINFLAGWALAPHEEFVDEFPEIQPGTPAGEDAPPAEPDSREGPTAGDPETGAAEVVPVPFTKTRLGHWIKTNVSPSALIEATMAGSGKVLGVLGYMIGFAMVPIYLYFFLKESSSIRTHWHDYVPLRASSFKDEVVDCMSEINGYILAFFRGQVLVAFIDGFLIGVALMIFQVPYALVIGLAMAVLGVIPFVGNILCLIPACIIAYVHWSGKDPIESPNIPTVGVGEATVPNMPRTLIECGISESEFFRTCNSSFKLGVLFDHWNVDEEGKPIQFVNPFQVPPNIDGVEMAAYYAKFGAGELDFVHLFSPSLDLFEGRKGPRGLRSAEFSHDTAYAYHLDAGKFAGMLREVCVARGVRHIYDNLQEVDQDERGHVSALFLEQGGRLPVELVIDCTGFRGLVINQVLGGEFVSYSKYLANDKAMAVQIPHSSDRIEPMTRSTALGAGWSWRVPLFNRVGTGYVYSSAHRTDDEARDEFMAFLGPAAEGLEPRVIPMRIGRNRETWIKNCVAIGLSGGFIEPLESTAIHMIDMAVRQLLVHFPDQSYAEPLRTAYNRQTQALFDEVLDFICLHYRLGNRTDSPYWIDARESLEIPDRLAENLELWKHALPMPFHLDTTSFFGVGTYHAVLLGKRIYQMGYGAPGFAAGLPLNEDKWWQVVARQRARFADMAEKAPDHRHLLRDIRGELSSRERRKLERGETLDPGRAAPELAESSLL